MPTPDYLIPSIEKLSATDPDAARKVLKRNINLGILTEAQLSDKLTPLLRTPVVRTPVAGSILNPLLTQLNDISRPKIGSYQPIAPEYENMAPVAITRPAPSYYQNLFNAKFAPLGEEYFGKGGISDVSVGELNRRGFITGGPSGVAGQIYEKTVTDPFARATANIQNQVNIIKTETEMDLAKYDATRRDEFRNFMANLQDRDSTNAIESAKSQTYIDQTYINLESEIRQAIEKGATEEKIAELNARVNTFNILTEADIAEKKLREERLRRQGDWWNTAGQFAGGLGPNVPYRELDVPYPVPIDKNGNPIGGRQTYSSPPFATGTNVGNQIRFEDPGVNGAPPKEGTQYGNDEIANGQQSVIGSDGRPWWYNRQQGYWSNLGSGTGGRGIGGI